MDPIRSWPPHLRKIERQGTPVIWTMDGTMHLARELMLKATVKAPLVVVRSTLINGEGDPHSGYGPNRFRRLAAAGQEIVLFGEGEERRDHVLIDDVAEIVCRVIERRSRGNA